MGRWIRADIQKVTSSDWRGFFPDYEQFFAGSTEDEAKEEARRILEETTGLKDFRIVWLNV